MSGDDNRQRAGTTKAGADESLDETFPASDPPSHTPETDDAAVPEDDARGPATERQLDESLDETFPASDPPSWTP